MAARSATPEPVPLRSLRAAIWTIVALAFAVRAVPLGHGLPGLYVPDTHSVRNALGMLQTRNLVPRSNEFSSYPYLYSYACLPVFVADYALSRATGRAQNTEEYQRDAAAHLERFHHLARWISAVAGALAAGAAVVAGAWLAGRAAGVWSGVLAASSPFFWLLSTHERPWASLFLMTTVALAFAMAYARGRSWPALAASAVFAGLAAGCHQAGATALLLPAGAAVARTGWSRAAIPALVKPALVVLAAFLPAFLAGNPYLARYGLRGAVPTDLTGAVDLSVGGQGLAFRFDAKHTKEALAGLAGLEGVVLLLGVAGAVLLTRRRDRAAWVPLALAVPVFVFFSFYTGTHARYFLLAFPALWILGGAALAALSGQGAWGRAAAVFLAAIPATLTLRGCQVLLREDTRNLALAAVPKAIPEGAPIAVEPYGPPLKPSRESLERLAAAETASPGVKILTRRERLALDRGGEGGYDLLPLERVVHDPAPGGYTRLGGAAAVLYPGVQTLDGVLRAANVRFVVRVDRFPGAHRADPLLEILLKRGRLLSESSPSDGRAYPLEALLPFEPRQGASSLFSVSRPGPLVRYYELRP